MQIKAGYKHKLPYANAHQKKKKRHRKDPKPSQIGFRAVGPKAVIFDILSEADPVCVDGIGESAGTIARLKSFKPKGFV